MIEFFLGFILMLFFFMISKFNTFLHGPNSNDYKKNYIMILSIKNIIDLKPKLLFVRLKIEYYLKFKQSKNKYK